MSRLPWVNTWWKRAQPRAASTDLAEFTSKTRKHLTACALQLTSSSTGMMPCSAKEPPLRRTRALGAAPQRSYLQDKIDKAAEEVKALSQHVAALEQDRAHLQATVETHAAGLDLADFELQTALMARLSLGRHTSELLHQQLQMQNSMAALPPADSWDTGTRTYIARLPREALRYLLLTGYRAYSQWLRDPDVFLNTQTVRDMTLWANKIKHVSYCFSKNPATWVSIVDSNLETGESQVPASVINQALVKLPCHTLPSDFFDYCREGLRLYHRQVDELTKRRFRIGQRVNALLQALPQSAQRAYSNNDSWPQVVNLVKHDASTQPMYATLTAQQATTLAGVSNIVGLDAACQLEREVRAFEDTMMQDFRARQTLLEYLLRKLPLHFIACYVVACQPYHTYLPTTLAALLRMHDPSNKARSVTQGMRPAQQAAIAVRPHQAEVKSVQASAAAAQDVLLDQVLSWVQPQVQAEQVASQQQQHRHRHHHHQPQQHPQQHQQHQHLHQHQHQASSELQAQQQMSPQLQVQHQWPQQQQQLQVLPQLQMQHNWSQMQVQQQQVLALL